MSQQPQPQPKKPNPADDVYLGYRDNRREFDVRSGAAAKRLGGQVKHNAERSANCSRIEEIILANIPFPFDVKFDLCCNQPPFFDSFIYTEFGHGMMLMTQSTEINHRMMVLAAEYNDGDTELLDSYAARLKDKYELKVISDIPAIPTVVMLPGSNRFNLADVPAIARLLDEDLTAMVKPHPLTNDNTFRQMRQVFGHDRILNPKASGHAILSKADTIYTTTGSETCFQAALLGKEVCDITNYEFATGGAYSHLNRQIHQAKAKGGKPAIRQTLANILSSPCSGILELNPEQGLTEDVLAERIRLYVEAALDIREMFRLMVRPARF